MNMVDPSFQVVVFYLCYIIIATMQKIGVMVEWLVVLMLSRRDKETESCTIG
jgi:hypothetical protein